MGHPTNQFCMPAHSCLNIPLHSRPAWSLPHQVGLVDAAAGDAGRGQVGAPAGRLRAGPGVGQARQGGGGRGGREGQAQRVGGRVLLGARRCRQARAPAARIARGSGNTGMGARSDLCVNSTPAGRAWLCCGVNRAAAARAGTGACMACRCGHVEQRHVDQETPIQMCLQMSRVSIAAYSSTLCNAQTQPPCPCHVNSAARRHGWQAREAGFRCWVTTTLAMHHAGLCHAVVCVGIGCALHAAGGEDAGAHAQHAGRAVAAPVGLGGDHGEVVVRVVVACAQAPRM